MQTFEYAQKKFRCRIYSNLTLPARTINAPTDKYETMQKGVVPGTRPQWGNQMRLEAITTVSSNFTVKLFEALA